MPADGEPLLVVVPTELGSALLHTWLERAYGFAPNRAPGAYLAALLSERGSDSASIGVDMSSIGLTAPWNVARKLSSVMRETAA